MGASLAAGFYKLLKILQYETVLGDSDTDSKAPSSKSKGDEEKNIDAPGGAAPGESSGSKGGDGTWQVSGPGLGDLHTTGEYNDVSLFQYFR
jgi:aquaporin related protein